MMMKFHSKMYGKWEFIKIIHDEHNLWSYAIVKDTTRKHSFVRISVHSLEDLKEEING